MTLKKHLKIGRLYWKVWHEEYSYNKYFKSPYSQTVLHHVLQATHENTHDDIITWWYDATHTKYIKVTYE